MLGAKLVPWCCASTTKHNVILNEGNTRIVHYINHMLKLQYQGSATVYDASGRLLLGRMSTNQLSPLLRKLRRVNDLVYRDMLCLYSVNITQIDDVNLEASVNLFPRTNAWCPSWQHDAFISFTWPTSPNYTEAEWTSTRMSLIIDYFVRQASTLLC